MEKLAVLIDANIFLDLYTGVGDPKFIGILQGSGSVFVSEQVADEVRRNRAQVARRYVADRTRSPFARMDISPWLRGELSASVRRDIDTLNSAAQKLKMSKLEKELVAVLDKVSHGTDSISRKLEQLFSTAAVHTQDELESARLRRERGNPPGKANDPLGDQLTWEQFLSFARDASRVVIVTRDGDYALQIGKSLVLNPILARDLERVARGCRIEVSSTLAGGVKSLGGSVKGWTKATLAEAEKVETAAAAATPAYGSTFITELLHTSGSGLTYPTSTIALSGSGSGRGDAWLVGSTGSSQVLFDASSLKKSDGS